MLVVFLFMAFCLGVLFYFQELFVTFLIGCSLIFITVKLRNLYRNIFGRKMRSKLLRLSFILMSLILLLTGVFFIIENAVVGIESVITIAREDLSEDSTLFDVYYERLHRFLPEKLATVLLTKENLNAARMFFLDQLGVWVPLLTQQFLTAILIVPMMFYIFFRKGESIMKRLYALIPLKFCKVARNTIRDTCNELDEYFFAKLIQGLVIAVVCMIGFVISGVKAPLLFAILAGLLNIIPFIGPVIGALPPLFIALLDPSGSVALGVVITIIAAQLIDNFYLQPFMLSSRLKMDALLSIVLVLLFAKLGGALGMILAIPIYSIFKVTLKELYADLVEVYDKKS